MGRIIVPTQADYEQNINSIRNLTWEGIDEKILPTSMIDSLVILQAVEDELLSKLPDAINPNHPNRSNIVRYLIYGSVIEILYVYPQLLSKTVLGQREQYTDIMEEKLDFLYRRISKIADALDIISDYENNKTHQLEFVMFLTGDSSSDIGTSSRRNRPLYPVDDTGKPIGQIPLDPSQPTDKPIDQIPLDPSQPIIPDPDPPTQIENAILINDTAILIGNIVVQIGA